jgi:ATP-dependent Clp protease protease subunit
MEYVMADRIIEEMKVQTAMRDRRIYLETEVDRESIFKCVYYMQRLKDMDDAKDIPIKKRKSIEIIIDSYGGAIYHGNSLISKIEEFKEFGYEIITTVQSVAMSMGFMILVSGSKRRAQRYASILFHQPSSGSRGTLQLMQDDLKETERLWELMKVITKKNTKLTEEYLEEVKDRNRDIIFNPQEALDAGIIDEIL